MVYIMPDCIVPSGVCGVKEWHDRDGTNNYDFDEECWVSEEEEEESEEEEE